MTDNNELFDGSVQDQDDLPVEDKDYLNELVGEGKKFKDERDLAKGKVESDRFIAQLQKELQGLRKELDTRISLEEFMERQNQSSKPSNSPEPKADEPGSQSGKVSQEDIQTLVRETLTKEQERVLHAKNLSSVKAKLQEQWGSNYATVLEGKAAELEVGKEFLNGLAMNNPTAFFRLVGVDGTVHRETYSPPPSSTVQTGRTSNLPRKTFWDYEKLRKENPREYFSPRVQNEMFKQAQEHGERFYQK